MLEAGWSRVDITPKEPVPLAGYTHWKERLSMRVRDPLYVRALAFREGATTAVELVYDLLLVTEELRAGIAGRLSDTGAGVLVNATHTHSSMGGIWDSFLARRFMGKPRPWVVKHLLDSGERAAREAIAALQPAEARSASAVLPGLNGNRRDPAGPKDEELTVLRLVRGGDEAIVFSYPAHPVIVAERDHHAISADFPGEAVRLLERDVAFAAYVQGSLGGVDVLFPPDKAMPADVNVRLMAEPLAIAALNLARVSARPGPSRVAFAAEDLALGAPDSRPFFDDELRRLVDLPLRVLLNNLVAAVPRVARVRGVRVGNWAVAGTPADLGVTIGLAGKDAARRAGIADPVVASQCDGYVGYLHRRDDYRKAPPGSHLGMARYENAMNFFGRDTGERVLAAVEKVFAAIA
jgi:hypothetical protein